MSGPEWPGGHTLQEWSELLVDEEPLNAQALRSFRPMTGACRSAMASRCWAAPMAPDLRGCSLAMEQFLDARQAG